MSVCVCVCEYVPGGVRLRGELPEERAQHPHRLHALHVHLRRHRRAALQREVLLLHRRVQRPGEGLQVRRHPPSPTVTHRHPPAGGPVRESSPEHHDNVLRNDLVPRIVK